MTISIHAPARGATHAICFGVPVNSDFNPRSREGSDGVNLSVSDKEFQISIHAPARGATIMYCPMRTVSRHFNPRSREGSDMAKYNVHGGHNRFQSTLPRGERRLCSPPKAAHHYFNPRSREGSDGSDFADGIISGIISIHAPARGATHKRSGIKDLQTDFNPRSREGSDNQNGQVLYRHR